MSDECSDTPALPLTAAFCCPAQDFYQSSEVGSRAAYDYQPDVVTKRTKQGAAFVVPEWTREWGGVPPPHPPPLEPAYGPHAAGWHFRPSVWNPFARADTPQRVERALESESAGPKHVRTADGWMVVVDDEHPEGTHWPHPQPAGRDYDLGMPVYMALVPGAGRTEMRPPPLPPQMQRGLTRGWLPTPPPRVRVGRPSPSPSASQYAASQRSGVAPPASSRRGITPQRPALNVLRVWSTAVSLASMELLAFTWLTDPSEGKTAVDASRIWLEEEAEADDRLAKVLPEVMAEARMYVQRWRRAFLERVSELHAKEAELGRPGLNAVLTMQASGALAKAVVDEHDFLAPLLSTFAGGLARWQRWLVAVALVLTPLTVAACLLAARGAFCCHEARPASAFTPPLSL